MGLFRRRKPLHEELAQVGGILMNADAGGFLAHPPDMLGNETTGIVGIHGVARPRRWDAVVSVEAPDVRGDEVQFVTLPDGSLLIDEEEGDASLDAFARAVEEQVQQPYRALGVRKSDTVWAVSATRIEVAQFALDGDAVELSRVGGEVTLAVDGIPRFGDVPELVAVGERFGSDFTVHAERLDGDLWEVQAAAL